MHDARRRGTAMSPLEAMQTAYQRGFAQEAEQQGSLEAPAALSSEEFLWLPWLLGAGTVAGWLLFWLVLDFRWWTGLLVGGGGGYLVGFILSMVCMFKGDRGKKRDKRAY
jgi:hypothetical protein